MKNDEKKNNESIKISANFEPSKMLANAKISPQQKKLKKKRIFKVSTFHH